MTIRFTTDLSTLTPSDLTGFFVGWPNPPSPERHLEILQGSFRAIVALDDARPVGFMTAISDGQLAAYLPLLEVLPEYQGQGIGSQLVNRMLGELTGLYMIDLCCDDDLVAFYTRFDFTRVAGMVQRNHSTLT
jgi:GNAT superfamily N-acetyltransferase